MNRGTPQDRGLTTVGEAAHRIAAAAGLGEPAGEDGSQGGR